MDLDEGQKQIGGQRVASTLIQGTTMVDKQIPQTIDLNTIRQQAHEHLKAGRWPLAGETFLELLNHNEQDEDALLGVAASLDGIGRYESLYKAAECLLELAPNSAAALAYKARALQKLERLSEATIANDQALLLDTNFPLAWINRSGLQLLQQKFPEALRSGQRAVELAPQDARAWANKGVALLNLDRLNEALEAFEQSLLQQPNPSHLFALQMKGEILCRMGRMTQALETVRETLALNSEDVTGLTQAAQALRALELYVPLQQISSELIKLTPDSLFAWEHYMRALRGQGQYEEANKALDRVLELDPSNIRFWTMKADTLYRLERYKEAAIIAERAVRLHHGYFPAHRIHEKALKMMYQNKKKRD